jgi:hypothetical protein
VRGKKKEKKGEGGGIEITVKIEKEGSTQGGVRFYSPPPLLNFYQKGNTTGTP